MLNARKILLVSAVFVSLTGCSTVTTTAYQKSGGEYQVVALSRSENDGSSSAIQKAKEICKKQNRQLIVLDNQTRYQGANKELGEVSDLVSSVSFNSAGVYVPSLRQDNDYKTLVTFRCQ